MQLFQITLLVIAIRVSSTNQISVEDVSEVLSKLVKLDKNACKSGEVIVEYQKAARHKVFKRDNSPQPLFSSVNDRINQKPSFVALRKLQELYKIPNVNEADPMTPERVAAARFFIKTIFYTDVIQNAWLFLGKAGLVSLDLVTFQDQLYDLWFGGYARQKEVGSSGFENVFVGEISGKKVLGLNNWYRFYQLEKQGSVNYHGWFERIKDFELSLQFSWDKFKAWKDEFFLGTSPEFDIAVFTVCALSKVQYCILPYGKFDVLTEVETFAPSGESLRIKSVELHKYKAHIGLTTHPQNGTTERTRTTKPHLSNLRLQKLVNDMRAADVDKPIDYELNWGNPAIGRLDTSHHPLFTYVNETVFERPIYRALIDMYAEDVFIPQVCEAETPINKDPRRELVLKNVFYNFTSTKVFQLAFEYLQEINYATDLTTFLQKLWTYWFGTYSRCKGPLGSSGFEHVFNGEWRFETVDGLHSWVKFYLLERRGAINYHGYHSHDENLAGTTQYTWGNHGKWVGGFNVGTSPAFDFSLLSVCALVRSGHGCRFTIDGFPMAVMSQLRKCGNQNDTCIEAAYPVI